MAQEPQGAQGAAGPGVGKLPPGWGVARCEDTGVASHELIYEFEYFPTPTRKLSPDTPPDDECTKVLRPSMHNGKVAFSFFGIRVPLTADHGRCWLGQLLLKEANLGHLHRVEFVIPSADAMPAVQSLQPRPGNPVGTHGPQPSWLWHVWPDADSDDAHPVTVVMEFSPSEGVGIMVESSEAARRGKVYRAVRQYCDDADGGPWCPIPVVPTKISKVHDRAIPADQLRTLQLGGRLAAQESPNQMALRLLDEQRDQALRVHQALARVGATCASAGFGDALLYLGEVQASFEACEAVRVKLRAEWLEVAVGALETLMRRLLEAEAGAAAAELRKAVDLATSLMHRFGCRAPAQLAGAEERLKG